MDLRIRPLRMDETDAVKWTLYAAVSWDPSRKLPPYEAVIDHPELARYHVGWGRPGDIGVVAELGDDMVGVAFCRLFTELDHGHGYVDDRTPEVAVAVSPEHRSHGIGGQLMRDLAAAARRAGFEQLSLSVDEANPALGLYQRLGYRELRRDEDGVLMALDLRAGPTVVR
jgi:ribosomal protein S18 acetylase RimI-like enzyme